MIITLNNGYRIEFSELGNTTYISHQYTYDATPDQKWNIIGSLGLKTNEIKLFLEGFERYQRLKALR
jgi:hypothetical protein